MRLRIPEQEALRASFHDVHPGGPASPVSPRAV